MKINTSTDIPITDDIKETENNKKKPGDREKNKEDN